MIPVRIRVKATAERDDVCAAIRLWAVEHVTIEGGFSEEFDIRSSIQFIHNSACVAAPALGAKIQLIYERPGGDPKRVVSLSEFVLASDDIKEDQVQRICVEPRKKVPVPCGSGACFVFLNCALVWRCPGESTECSQIANVRDLNRIDKCW